MNTSNTNLSPVSPASPPAEPTKKRKPRAAAAKTGLVEKLQGQLKEARKIDKAIAIVAELSHFGVDQLTQALTARREILDSGK